mmetsp:Transcript_12480/g.19789  ORF Transcript_12480/g.19789 Transcript_12480/m.19789 type:complete len:86 (+) Transcript_12480:53-310(+)
MGDVCAEDVCAGDVCADPSPAIMIAKMARRTSVVGNKHLKYLRLSSMYSAGAWLCRCLQHGNSVDEHFYKNNTRLITHARLNILR